MSDPDAPAPVVQGTDTVPGLTRLERRVTWYLLAQTAVERLILFVIPVAIYVQTGSLGTSGIAYAAEWLPTIVFLPMAGALVDRCRGDAVLRTTNLVRAVVCVLAAASVWFELGAAALIGVGAVLGVANIFAYLTFERYVFGLAPTAVASAYSYFQTLQYVMLLLMPLLGSLALSGGRLSLLLAVCGAAYALALAPWLATGLMGRTSSVAAEDTEPDPGWRQILGGTVDVLRDAHARSLVALLFAVNLVYGTLYTALPALTGAAASSVHLLPVGYGAAAAISLAYFLLVPRLNSSRLVARLGLGAALSTTALPLVLFLVGSPAATALVFALSVGPMVAFTIYVRVLRNRLLGGQSFALKASVLMMGSTAAYPLAGGYLSVVGDRLSPHVAVATVSVFSLVVVLAALRTLRPHLGEAVSTRA